LYLAILICLLPTGVHTDCSARVALYLER
jgi:hypothetical protein